MKTKKKWLIGGIALILVAAIGTGIFFGTRGKTESVGVYPFDQVGMTEYWGDSQESYGPVSTDKIQTVFLSSTQTVTEILVSEGDQVKKGDLLMTFDTTLSDLALERKRLEVEKLKLQLESAQKELQEIKNMKPMTVPSYDDEDEGYQGVLLTEPYMLSTQKDYDGSKAELALICWLRDDASISDTLLETLRRQAEEFQNENARNNTPEPDEGEDDGDYTEGEEETYTVQNLSAVTTEGADEETGETEGTGDAGDSTETTTPGDKPYEPFAVTSYYVVFKITKGNMSLGSRTTWQGMKVVGSGSDFSFRFFDAVSTPDHMNLEDDGDYVEGGSSGIDFGSGYTSAQLAELRSEQEKKIKELEFQIKMADADYKIAQTEMADGNVYAEFDGKVSAVLTEDEAKNQGLPVLKVSGGGGFYIEGSVSELERDKMELGQEVTVNDWNTGMTYTGNVVAIGDFPSQDDNWNGSGNPNVTYYPLTVFVDETAELQAGRYASITFSAAASQHGLYLRNPFLRTEQGESFVYVMGKGNKLEKRVVTIGKSLWGSYTEILSGLTEDDLIAFPYGKTVKEGAPAQEGDVSDLYR